MTLVSMRPRFQGANIRTWIGFKHLLYLVEEAVLQWFRERGLGPQHLFHEYGAQLEIIESSALLVVLMEADDVVAAKVEVRQGAQFSVRLLIRRGESDVVSVKAKVTVALRPGKDASGSRPYSNEVVRWLSQISDSQNERHDLLLTSGQGVESLLAPPGSRAFLWTWRARYFDCCYSRQVQHSTYVRVLEEVVDRFLADRGISITRMLTEYKWIPVVSRVRVATLAEAYMDETICTTFVVEDVMKRITFDGRMDCYARRGSKLVHTATAHILHGYAISEGERAGQLTELDQATIDALCAEVPR
jgi:acyl-CoA thioesterase FadM